MRSVRLLPAFIAVVGILLLILGESDTTRALGGVLIGVGVLVALVNLLSRLAISSEHDRARERGARRRFTRTGRWPRDS